MSSCGETPERSEETSCCDSEPVKKPDQTYFGATSAGLGMTLVIATILEICSEGSTPIAADLVSRAQTPGNGFAFLMTGVSTDYTEIMSLREH